MTYPTSHTPTSTATGRAHSNAKASAKSGTKPTEKPQNPDRDRLDADGRLDKDLEETFPASDAPATGGVTKIDRAGEETGKPRHTDVKKTSGKPSRGEV